MTPLSRYLADFGRESPPAWTAGEPAACFPLSMPDRAAASEEALAAARAEGWAEGRTEGRREADETLAALKAAYEERLAAERAAWVRDQGEALAVLLSQGLDAFERRVTEQVAAVLGDLVVAGARERMVAELSEVLGTLRAGNAPVVSVEGPADLLDALRDRLGRDAASVHFTPSAGPDIQVAAGEARLETRLGVWRDRVLADDA